MPNARAAETHDELARRIGALDPGRAPRWGRLDASRMVCHLIDSLEMATGARAVRLKPLWPFRVFPLKHLVLHALPMPRGAPTAPELLATRPSPTFDADRARLLALLQTFAAMPDAGPGAVHPLFGRLGHAKWGALVYKHMDHHLRQFGA